MTQRRQTIKLNKNNNLVRSTGVKNLAQAKWHEIGKVKEELKSQLPSLKPTEVRRFYVPRNEAIILELEESNFHLAANYLRELFEFDEEERRNAGPGTLIWRKPRLKYEVEFVDRLKDNLILREEAKNFGDAVSEATALLDSALFFQSKTWEWWWIADRLFLSALEVAKSISGDEDHVITIIRYLYGRFLLNQMQNAKEALCHLNPAREASEGKIWNVSKILNEKQDAIFKESNVLLFKALITLSEGIACENIELAVESCEEALNRATDSGQEEHIMVALYELGRNNFRSGNYENALQNFSKLLAISKRIPDAENVCNAHMELAFVYKKLRDDSNTEKHLNLFRELAMDFGLIYKLAQANYYIGEHFLNRGKANLATNYLESAFKLYDELGSKRDADRARSVAAVSKGQEKITEYLRLIKVCGDKDPASISKLLDWKGRREPFWIKQKPETNITPWEEENDAESPTSFYEASDQFQLYI